MLVAEQTRRNHCLPVGQRRLLLVVVDAEKRTLAALASVIGDFELVDRVR